MCNHVSEELICELCGEVMVRHKIGDEKHVFYYDGAGAHCNVDNCEKNHGRYKCVELIKNSK